MFMYKCIFNLLRVGLRFDGLGVCRLEEPTDNQLSIAVDVGVGHVLFIREAVGSLQRLDPEC